MSRRHTQIKQSICADGGALGENLKLPEHVAVQFEFGVPSEATQGGLLIGR